MKIGIVGSGIAGLSAAWSLNSAGHDVTLFEKQSKLGMDAHSIEFPIDGRTVTADVPSRMFNRSRWPNLIELYEKVGVKFEPVDTSQAFSFQGKPPFFSTKLPYQVSQLLGHLGKATSRKTIAEIKSLQSQGQKDLKNGLSDDLTFRNYLGQNNYSAQFINGFLYPALASTVCTCSYQSLDNYPATIVLETLEKLTSNQALLRTSEGTRDVVSRLTANLRDVRLNSTVQSITDFQSHVDVTSRTSGNPESLDTFEHLILATQANHVANLVPDLIAEEKAVLDSFKYEPIAVTVHTDTSVLPSNPADWATFNFVANDTKDSVCHVLLNRFHSEWDLERSVLQTIGAPPEISPDALVETLYLQRPVVSNNSLQALLDLAQLHAKRDRRIWFCGSYASRGVPLLETGVVSAMEIVKKLNSD